jgi:hypothetical protein
MNVEVKFNSALIFSFWCQNLCIQNSHAIMGPLQQGSHPEISNIWSDKWILHYENALSYTMQNIWTKKQIPALWYPLYSPHLFSHGILRAPKLKKFS